MKTVEELSREADELADAEIAMPGEYHPDWHDVRDQYFRDLVLEEAAKVCEGRAGSVSMFVNSQDARNNNNAVRGCAAAIRAMKGQK